MNRIDEMIKELCPEGVDTTPLWEVTAWDKKFNAVDKSMQSKIIKYNYFLAKELDEIVDETGDIRILYTTEDIAYTTEEKAAGKISEGEIVAIPWGGNPTVKYYKGRFVTGDNRIATSLDKAKLDNKFLYYWMLSKLDDISIYYRGAGIKHPSMFSVLTMSIPLPPLSIQQEIVSILDKFTDHIADLDTAIKLRQKQFEYYREFLINDNVGEDRTIKEFTKVLRGKRLTKNMLSDENVYPVYHGGNEPIGRYSESNRKANTVMVINVGASAGTVGFCNEDFWSSDGCFCLEKKYNVLDKYVFYALKNKERQIMSMVRNAGIPTLDSNAVEKISIPLPSYEKQCEIVSKLDKFEACIRELETVRTLRQKQYEYYRNKLLSFK